MKKLLFFFLLALSFVILTGCNEEAPTSIIDVESATLHKGAPASSGAVARYEDNFYQWFYDAKTDLTIITGIDDPTSLCAGFGLELNVLNFKDILSPSNKEDLRTLRNIKGDVYVEVRQGNVFLASSLCDFVNNSTLVASGIANFRLHDNDYFAYLEEYTPKNKNSFGTSLNGKLTTPDGKSKNLNAFDKVTWDGNDLNASKENIKVQLK